MHHSVIEGILSKLVIQCLDAISTALNIPADVIFEMIRLKCPWSVSVFPEFGEQSPCGVFQVGSAR